MLALIVLAALTPPPASTAAARVEVRALATIVSGVAVRGAGNVAVAAATLPPPRERPCADMPGPCRLIVYDLP